MSIVMEKPDSAALRERLENEEEVIAPDLFLYELSSAVRKHYKIGQVDFDTATNMYHEGAELVENLVEAKELGTSTLVRSLILDHSPYDVAYLVLAKRTGAALMTLDRKLAALCAKEGVECVTTAA